MSRIISLICCVFAAFTSLSAMAQAPRIASDAPDTYTVVRGDTLWGISGRFLAEPWRWPEVWRLNRSEINNPHLIYPGQVVILDRSGPYLSVGRQISGSRDQRLSPRVYSEPAEAAIPSIPTQDIEPFLNRPLVVDAAELENAGTIIAIDQERLMTTAGDTIFAKDLPEDAETVQIFRPARALEDPDTGETLAYEADYLGTAQLTAPGRPPEPETAESEPLPHPSEANPIRDPFYGPRGQQARQGGTAATLRVTRAIEEIVVGDRLVQSESPTVFSYAPRAPEHDVSARVISMHGGMQHAGPNQVITLDQGERDGLQPGHVLALQRVRGSVEHQQGRVTEIYDLPEQRFGVVMVFRVSERVAQALVMEAEREVRIGDTLHRP